MISIFENDNICIDKIEIDNIPCLKIRPRGKKELLPTVLYYHGWSSNKDFQYFKGAILSSQGYQVIIPDALHHGERGNLDYDNVDVAENYFFDIIFQNVEESKKIIDYIIENYDVDPNRMAVMGSSMGGFSAAGIFIQNPMLKCLVVFNGSCAWINSANIFRQEGRKLPLNNEEILELSKFDPLRNTHLLKQRPILLLHGDSDSLVSIDSQRLFYNEVSPLYKENPDNIKFIEYPRLNHYLSVGMFEEALLWLKKYL